MTAKLLPTSLVGSYPQPDWLIDRERLAGRFPPRVRARELWRNRGGPLASRPPPADPESRRRSAAPVALHAEDGKVERGHEDQRDGRAGDDAAHHRIGHRPPEDF